MTPAHDGKPTRQEVAALYVQATRAANAAGIEVPRAVIRFQDELLEPKQAPLPVEAEA